MSVAAAALPPPPYRRHPTAATLPLPPQPPMPRVLILSKHKNELELAALYAPLIVLSEVLLYREKVHSIRRAWKKVQCQEHQSDAWRIDTWTMKMDYESMHRIYIRRVSSYLSYSLVMIMNYRRPMKPFFIETSNFWAWANKSDKWLLGHLGNWLDYQHQFWYCESLVHVFHYSTTISTKT